MFDNALMTTFVCFFMFIKLQIRFASKIIENIVNSITELYKFYIINAYNISHEGQKRYKKMKKIL